MSVARYTFKTLPPEWRNCELWPCTDLSMLDQEVQQRYERLSRGLRLYLQTGKLRLAAKEGGCSGPVLIDQLNRCVSVRDNGELVGWQGLISRTRLKAYTRSKPLQDGHGGTSTGKAGAFSRFIEEHDVLREKLHKLIQAGGGKRSTKSRLPSLLSVFKSFRQACLVGGLTYEDYPLNTKSQGRRSIERYARRFIQMDTLAIGVWYGQEARATYSIGTGNTSFPFATAPLDVVGFDAHKLHCIGVIVVNGPAGPQRVPIERIWLNACVDQRSRCILGYSISIRKEISSSHVEEALVTCTRPWKPRDLRIAGLTYLPDAGLPVGRIEGLTQCRPCVLLMDNAAQHYANRIVQTARRSLGCAITFGPVGAWWHNAITERFFKTLELHGFQCLPSSTGSHPKDALRGSSVKEAIKHTIEWEELVDLADVLITNYNATPHRGLGSRSPLDVLRGHLEVNPPTFMSRIPPPPTANTPELGLAVETKRIAGSCKKGKVRQPYVEIDKVRYTSSKLVGRFDLLQECIVVHIDERDMRLVKGFLESGEPLGDLMCLDKGWSQAPHTRDMRKAINALITAGELMRGCSDYVMAYLDYLAKKVSQEVISKPGSISSAATRLADVVQRTGIPPPALKEGEELQRTSFPARPLPSHIKQPSWRSS